MKKIYSTILPIVMILCLAMLSSCSGNSDETENGGTDDGILRITADKTAIQAEQNSLFPFPLYRTDRLQSPALHAAN